MDSFNTSKGNFSGRWTRKEWEYDVFKHSPVFERNFRSAKERTWWIYTAEGWDTLYPPALFSATCCHAVDLTSHRLWRALGTWPCHQRKRSQACKDFRAIPADSFEIWETAAALEACQWLFSLLAGMYSFRHVDNFFAYWEKPIYLLRPSVEGYRNPQALLAGNIVDMAITESDEKSSH